MKTRQAVADFYFGYRFLTCCIVYIFVTWYGCGWYRGFSPVLRGQPQSMSKPNGYHNRGKSTFSHRFLRELKVLCRLYRKAGIQQQCEFRWFSYSFRPDIVYGLNQAVHIEIEVNSSVCFFCDARQSNYWHSVSVQSLRIQVLPCRGRGSRSLRIPNRICPRRSEIIKTDSWEQTTFWYLDGIKHLLTKFYKFG